MHLTYFNGEWAEGNTPLFGAMDHSVWLGSSAVSYTHLTLPTIYSV